MATIIHGFNVPLKPSGTPAQERVAVMGQSPVSAARTPQMRLQGGKQGRAAT